MSSADPLDQLRERVAAAQAVAERLAEEAAAAGEEVPHHAGDAAAELHALAAMAQAVKALLPDDLWEQLCDLVRGLLMLVRAILDRWIDRLASAAPPAPVVRDIPVG